MTFSSLATESADKIDDALSVQEFNALRTFLSGYSGLYLSEDKTYLAQARLPQVAKNHNYNSLHELVNNMGSPTNNKLREEIAEAMATPETFFFRDTKPFDIVKQDILPKLIEARAAQKKLRIWSAACSSGQEVYSIAMILNEMGLWQQGWQIEMWATDFSKKILALLKNEWVEDKNVSLKTGGVKLHMDSLKGRIPDAIRTVVYRSFRHCSALENHVAYI